MLLNDRKPKLHLLGQQNIVHGCLTEVGAYESVCQPKQQVEEVVFMTEKPGSAVRQGGHGLTATSQITNHRFRQQETSELERRANAEKE